MDNLSDKQIAHLRELCRMPDQVPAEPLQRAAHVGLVLFGLMLDADLAERAERKAKPQGKPGQSK